MNNKRLKIGLFLDSFFPTIDGVVVVPYTKSVCDDKDRPYKVPVTEYRVSLI